MPDQGRQQPSSGAWCACLAAPAGQLTPERTLGMDSRYGEVSLLICPNCGRHWLRYFYEVEVFSRSGRWYLGLVTPEQAAALTAESARRTLEGLAWYYYGGSYYGGRSGRASGEIWLNP
ncbi:MAG: hypothetical protein ACRDHL_08680 [Candidatus Promineifilaceae bacterium]